MKKLLISAVAAVSFLGLAACSDNSKDANKAPESPPPAAAPAPASPSNNDTTTPPSTPAPVPTTPGTGSAPAN